MSWERLMLSWCTDTRTRLASRTPTHTQHKEISPFSATQSLRPWSPFQCYSGVMDKKAILVALSMWFSTHQVHQAPQALIHHSNAVWGQNHYMQVDSSYSIFYRGKHSEVDVGNNSPQQLWNHNCRSLRQSILNLCMRGKTHSQSKMWKRPSPT